MERPDPYSRLSEEKRAEWDAMIVDGKQPTVGWWRRAWASSESDA